MLNLRLGLLIFILANTLSCASAEPEAQSPVCEPQEKTQAQPIETTGIVHKIYKNQGTLSEYYYYVIKTEKGQIILLNKSRRSLGFDEWLDKTVSVKGIKSQGFLGFRKIPIEGLVVEAISE